MNILDISKEINANAHDKGFWDKGLDIPEKLMLIVSEVSEAMEADRKNRFAPDHVKQIGNLSHHSSEVYFNDAFEESVKDTFQDELADATIRIFDLAYEMGIDLSWHIQQKVRYNANRPKMHGGKKY